MLLCLAVGAALRVPTHPLLSGALRCLVVTQRRWEEGSPNPFLLRRRFSLLCFKGGHLYVWVFGVVS